MSKTVLIVEDDECHMKMLDTLLTTKGYGTLQSRDGSDAMDLAREHKPDLIIMDVQLSGISGLDLTAALKADDELKDIPVLAVTAFAMPGDKEKTLEAGCDGYISKPISVDNFLETVAGFIG